MKTSNYFNATVPFTKDNSNKAKIVDLPDSVLKIREQAGQTLLTDVCDVKPAERAGRAVQRGRRCASALQTVLVLLMKQFHPELKHGLFVRF